MDGKLYIKKIIRDDGQQLEFDAQEIYLAEDNTLLVRPDPATTAVNYTEADGGEMISQQNLTYDQEINGLIIPKSTPYWDLTSKLSRFFQIRHNYKIIYIKKSGEMFAVTHTWISKGLQILPVPGEEYSEWDITFTIGNTDWTEYAEDDSGEEIFSNSVQLPLIGAASGGEVWDEVGTVWAAETMGETSVRTVTGTNIVLTDVAGGIQALNNIYGDTEQTGTPTPSAPIPVNTVTGRQSVDINGTEYEVNFGKNLFDGGSIVAGDIANQNPTIRCVNSQTIYLQPGTYTFSWNATSPFRYSIGTNNVGPYPLSTYPSYNYSSGWASDAAFTFTTPGGWLTVQFSKENNATLTPAEIMAFELQLEKGSTATSYAPYIQAFGKNLFNGVLELGGYENGAKDTRTDRYRCSNKIPVQPNTTYTFSIDGVAQKYVLQSYNQTGAYINESDTQTGTFTTAENCYYITFRCFIADFTSNYASLKVQLEQGSTATAYEPNISGQLELCKIGDYQDYIYKNNGKWYYHREIGKTLANGGEGWASTSANVVSLVVGAILGTESNQPVLSSRYIQRYSSMDGSVFISSSGNRISVADYTNATSVNTWKTWLFTHPTEFYYALATPLDIEITNADLVVQLEALGSASLSIPNSAIVVSSPYIAGEISIDYLAGITSGGEMWEIGEGGVQSIYINSTKTIYPEWVVKGPCVNPKLQNNTTDTFAEYDGTVAEGQTLTVNFAEGTAYLDTALVTRSLTGIVSFVPGENIVGFNSDGGSTSTSTISWDNIIS